MDEFPAGIDKFVAFTVFAAGWVYAIAAYGVFLGGGLGWLPSAFLAIIALFIWRIVLLVGLVGLAVVAYFSN